MLNLNGRYRVGTVRSFLFLLLSLGFIFYSFLTVETGLNKVLTVNIPLHAEFPIPILFWCGVFVYLFAISVLMKTDFRKMAWSGLLLGFCVHFVLLILDLNTRNTKGEISWFSNLYSLYFEFMLYIVMSLLSLWSGVLLRLICSKPNINVPASLLYSIPLLFLYSSAMIFLYHNYVLFAAMVIVFLSAFFLRQKDGLYINIKRKIRHLFIIIFDEKVFLPLIFIVSMFFRVVFLKRIMTNPDFINTASDGGFLSNLATNFLAGRPAYFPGSRGYWTFLAGIYYIFGTNYFTVGFIQSLFGTVAVIITYLIAKRVFGMVTARITAIIAALDFPLIFSAVGIGHEAMDIFFGVLIAYLLIKYKDMGISIKSALLLAFTGFICGLAMATREVNVLLPFVASGWIIYTFRKVNYKRPMLFGAISLFLLFSLFGMGIFLYSNYLETGSFYDQSSQYGVKSVLNRFNPQLTDIGFDPTKDMDSSLRIVKEKPLLFLKAAWLNYYTKFMDLYFSQGYGGFDPIFLVRKPTTNYYLSMWFYAYLLTLVGIASAFFDKIKKNRILIFLLLLIILYKTLFHLFTIAVYRYRAAIEPFLIIFFAYGLYMFIQFIRNKMGIFSEEEGQ